MYAPTYHPQTNSEVIQFNYTRLAALRHYFTGHPRAWDEFTNAHTYAYSAQPQRSTSFAPFELVLACSSSILAPKARPGIEQNHSPRQWYLRWKSRLAALMHTADQQLWQSQTQFKWYFDDLLRRTTDIVSPKDLLFVETSLANQLHILDTFARGRFLVMALDPHTVTIQRSDNSENQISGNHVANSTEPRLITTWELPPALHDHSCFSRLPTRRHHRTVAVYGSTLKVGGTGGRHAYCDNSSTPLHDVEHYRALNCANISKQHDYVISRIVNESKQTSVGTKYCIRLCGYGSNADTRKPIYYIPRSRIITVGARKLTPPENRVVASQVHCQYLYQRKKKLPQKARTRLKRSMEDKSKSLWKVLDSKASTLF